MNAMQSTFGDAFITREEWTWVEELIRDVERDHLKEAFAKRLFQWDLAVQQFRKIEQRRLLLQPPTQDDLRYHAICLHALLAIGNALVIQARSFKPEDLATFDVRHAEVEAYVSELNHTLNEWHHGFSKAELEAARNHIFGGKT